MNAYEAAQREEFTRMLATHGVSREALGFSERSQAARFRVFADLGIDANSSVLDVGCGLAHFLDHLQAEGRGPRAYTGIDLMPEFLDEASRRHPEATFSLDTVFTVAGRYDWVVASGIFFMTAPDWWGVVEAWMRRALAVADRGVAVNFLSSRSPNPDGVSFYADPERVLAIAERVAEADGARAALRHDYLPHDFTIILLRGRA